MHNISFLERTGKLVSCASEVKPGDIVGCATSQHDVRLYYVDRVEIIPSPPCLLPRVPRVFFKSPHVGLVFALDGTITRHYIHTPMPGQAYRFSWADYSKTSGDEMAQLSKDDDFFKIIKDEIFDMYLVNNEQYKKLGSLIAKVEVPTWGIMSQTTDGEELIFSFVEDIQEDLKKASEAYDRIRERMFRKA